MPSSDQIIYVSSTSPSPAPEPATARSAPSEEHVRSSPDPISLETTTADVTAPQAKKRKVSSDWIEDAGLYTPRSTKGDSPPEQTLDSQTGRKFSHVKSPELACPPSHTLKAIQKGRLSQKIKRFGTLASFSRSTEADTSSSMITRFTDPVQTSEAWRCVLWTSSTLAKA